MGLPSALLGIPTPKKMLLQLCKVAGDVSYRPNSKHYRCRLCSADSKSWSAFGLQPMPVAGGTAGDEPTTSGPVGCKGRARMRSLRMRRTACFVLSS